MAAGMGREPVVGKHRIGAIIARVFEQVHLDPFATQGIHHARHLVMGALGKLLRRAIYGRGLETIILRRFRVGLEMVRADHDDGTRGLKRCLGHSRSCSR